MPPPPDGSYGSRKNTFYQTVTDAVADIAAHGYDSQARVDAWLLRIRQAAQESMTPEYILQKSLNDTMRGVYQRMIEREQVLKLHPGVSRFTLDKVKPRLRAELDRRIQASAGLIKLNRVKAIEETLQRFAGWSTSIPPGGSEVVDKVDVKADIRKALASLPFEERRVAIDQGHKFVSELSDIIATDGGAIAAIWHQHHTTYPRKAHTERDGHIFLIRNSWAHAKGLVKPGTYGYTDQIERPAEWVYCSCSYEYRYGLRDLPDEMLTQKGRDELARVRAEIAAMAQMRRTA